MKEKELTPADALARGKLLGDHAALLMHEYVSAGHHSRSFLNKRQAYPVILHQLQDIWDALCCLHHFNGPLRQPACRAAADVLTPLARYGLAPNS
ncbi:hypothetical protein ES705_29079 [subsurface metagenome]